MRSAPLDKVVSAIAAAALLVSGSAQALYRCGSDVRASCCCEKDRPVDQARMATPDPHACCSITAAPVRRDDAAPQAAVSQPGPVLVAVAFTVPAQFQAPAAPSHDPVDLPRSGPPILLATCSFLI